MRSDDESPERATPHFSIIRISIADMSTLRVRTQEGDSPSPKFLYQLLARDAMTLFATIPSTTSAVSIPQLNGRYPISRECPAEPGEDFVITYERRPNGRYEAVEVLSQGAPFSVTEVREIARFWVEGKLGGLAPVPGRHAYFSPTREQWGVIQRDGGFVVLDSSALIPEITGEITRIRAGSSTSGLIVRIPVYASSRSPVISPLIVFAQVELTLDPQPGLACRWTSFVEFQRMCALRSRPPEPVIDLFRNWQQLLATESGFKSWSFRRGVFFGDHIEWWGDQSRRRTTHEGIDFVEGFRQDGTIETIRQGTPVRALADGIIVAVLDDFLNKTVVVCHPSIRDAEGAVCHTLYSHIHPENATPGPVVTGQILGRVEKAKNARAPAHMHFTGAWIPESIQASEITMDMISSAFAPIVLINLNALLSPGGP